VIAADDRRARQRAVALTAALAGTFVAFHVPFLPRSLEDLDSINFALGLRHFDVARHQPHPPGYPLFILLAEALNAVVRSEVTSLALLSIVAGAAGALAIVALHRRMFEASRAWAIAAGAVAVTSPLYWLTASRPLSDMAGLAAAMAIQAMTLGAQTVDGLLAASFAAGLATGIRSQVAWLTAPLLIWQAVRLAMPPGNVSRQLRVGAAFILGVLSWLVPLIVMTGGPRAYWGALSSQGGEDLSGIQMLWTTPTLRTLVDAMYYALVAPWAIWPAALVVLGASLLGFLVAWRREPTRLVTLAIAFGPYLVFDVLFQETFTSRYALPLVIPTAFLAVRGLRTLPAAGATVAVAALLMWNAHVGGRSVAALGREPAPAFRLLADMRAATGEGVPVLAPDRRQSFDLRRPLVWLNDDAPRFARQLPAPPQHEWLEAVKYWNAGGRAPVWFVVDPRRAAVDLVQHSGPSRYRWSLPFPVLMSGTRPGDADWYTVYRPDWYVGEGWALTPESAGVADADRRGLQHGPIVGWARSAALDRGAFLIGGRNFEPTTSATLSVTVEGGLLSRTLQVRPGSFLDVATLDSRAAGRSLPEYLKIAIATLPPARVAIEQFDVAPAGRGVLGFGAGWHERELDLSSGRQWRWLSDRGELRYVANDGWRLHIEGESPSRYYSRASRIMVRSGDRVLEDVTATSDFTIDVPLPVAEQPATIWVETDQTHVPAETRWRRSPDRRRLGLRIFRCELLPAFGRGTGASSPRAR
jgi:hypothetical protein